MDDNTAWVLTFAAIVLIVAAVSFARAWQARTQATNEPQRLRAEAELVRAKTERKRMEHADAKV
jgi:hypothetical protein